MIVRPSVPLSLLLLLFLFLERTKKGAEKGERGGKQAPRATLFFFFLAEKRANFSSLPLGSRVALIFRLFSRETGKLGRIGALITITSLDQPLELSSFSRPEPREEGWKLRNIQNWETVDSFRWRVLEPCVVNLVSSIKWRTLGLIKWWKSRSRNRRKEGRDGTGRDE